MIAFEIKDMTCGLCRAAITDAVLGVDSAANIEVDLVKHLIQIKTAEKDSQRFFDAIAAARYTPKRIGMQAKRAQASSASACCCNGAGASCRMRISDFMTAPATTPRHSGPPAERGPLPLSGGSCCSGSTANCPT